MLAPVAWPGAPRFTSGHPGTGYMSTPGVWTAGRTDEPVQPAVRGWSSSLVGLSLPSPKCRFCDVAKVAMIEKEDLARSGYKINMRVILFIFLTKLL